ncbi:PxKF domain-containing protein [Microbacterium sp. NPDC019599]|uniref:PxKF domain-containing protein n=1 Tax=Microbacterium sp. NPDC019599 TaxID=3154690 RepID=UPI0033EDC5CB
MLAVYVLNKESVAADVQVTTTLGDKSVAQLAAGAPTYLTFSATGKSLAAGVATIVATKTINGVPKPTTYEAAYLAVNCDTAGPDIATRVEPAANAFGWNNTDVSVRFTCTDDSGVAGCAGDVTLTNEGLGQTAPGDAVDLLGNHSSTVAGPINIDKTAPTLTGALTTGPNAAGWLNGDAVVEWTGDDALSGLNPATQPASTTVTGEGVNLTAGPVTVADKAGNVSAPATVTGIKIDRTAPVVTGATTTAPNSAGWYRDAVLVDFSCQDVLSGVAECPTSTQISGDGANQSVTSAAASDLAGNTATATVTGLNIDGTAPSTTIDNQCVRTNGYCTGSTATVVLTAADQAGLSGIQEIHYRIGQSAEQIVPAALATVDVPIDGTGGATISYWAVDRAGNREEPKSTELLWDAIAPTVTHVVSPAPNANGWNTTDVTVHFDARDNDSGSGILPGSITADQTLTGQTSGTEVSGTASDVAGNVGTDTVTVRIDKTAPTITPTITGGTLGANGWYTTPVTVHFTCADALSGIAACPDDLVLSDNGVANNASGTATDRAGNTASASISGIKIDREKPQLRKADVSVEGGIFMLGAVPTASCTATDSHSGVVGCVVTVTGGTANGVGTFSYTAVATDEAGNKSTVTGTYRVVYFFLGFLPPVIDVHPALPVVGIYKSGSTLPVHFMLFDAQGRVVQTNTAPKWLAPVKGSATTAPLSAVEFASATTDSGSAFRYTGGLYQYNWKVTGAGYYWRIGAQLDDGQTYFATIGVR